MIILVCGGSASGKSKIAENICCTLPKPHYYIATMVDDCFESNSRIKKHKNMREGKGFETLECCRDLNTISFKKQGTVLLECVGNLLANEMFKKKIEYNPTTKILKDIDDVMCNNSNTVIVTNDIFARIDGLSDESLQYVKNLAYLNVELAKKADVVVEVIYSYVNVIKGKEIWEY